MCTRVTLTMLTGTYDNKGYQYDVLACESVDKITYNSLKEAYIDCKKNKFSKESAISWDVRYEENLY